MVICLKVKKVKQVINSVVLCNR